MIIRKVSIGPDYTNNAMHYIHGQTVLGGRYIIHQIDLDRDVGAIRIWVKSDDSEIVLWKEFNSNMPMALEYNINF